MHENSKYSEYVEEEAQAPSKTSRLFSMLRVLKIQDPSKNSEIKPERGEQIVSSERGIPRFAKSSF